VDHLAQADGLHKAIEEGDPSNNTGSASSMSSKAAS
jgi:hypothetical protein